MLLFHNITASLQQLHVFWKNTNKAWNNVYYENILFHKNSWMSSNKNAWNQCKVQNYNEDKQFFHELLLVFQ